MNVDLFKYILKLVPRWPIVQWAAYSPPTWVPRDWFGSWAAMHLEPVIGHFWGINCALA